MRAEASARASRTRSARCRRGRRGSRAWREGDGGEEVLLELGAELAEFVEGEFA